MQTLTHLIPELQALLGEQADRLSRSTRFLQRKRCFSGSTFAQTLVLGWLQNPDATLCELANMASALNVQISPQALAQRFTPECADFLKALLLQACQLSVESAFSPEIFSRFSQVFVLDSSVLMLPKVLQEHWLGCGGNQGSNAGLKLHVGIDLCRGQLNLKLSDARSHDLSCELAEMPLPSGSLRLTDLGYFNLDKLSAYNEQGVFWLRSGGMRKARERNSKRYWLKLLKSAWNCTVFWGEKKCLFVCLLTESVQNKLLKG